MKKARKLYLLKISQRPQQEININIIRLLPRSNNKDAIVIIVDQFIKMIRLKITTTVILSEEIAKIYKNNIWKIHRIPKKILSNRGPQFVLWYMEDLSKISKTKRTLSTVYYFQTNSQTERIN